MILDVESWMNIRRFRVLHEAGATFAEIARECGGDWRTVKKYLAEDGVVLPPRASSRGRHPAAEDRPVHRGGGCVAAPRHHGAGECDP